MILTIQVKNEEVPNIMKDIMDENEITVTGVTTSMFIHNDAVDKAFEKLEQFENLISMGLIDKRALKQVGYTNG